MKKVLILAYDFPPYISVGGLRPYSWYKYFHEFGVYPIIVTRQWSNEQGNHLDYISQSASKETITTKSEFGTIVSAPYKPNFANRLMLKYGESKFWLVRKSISAYYEFAQYVFPVGPKQSICNAAKDYLENNTVDVIIATGDPFVLFKYASKLGKKYNIPWIADYRDPWSQLRRSNNAIIFNKYQRYFEKKIVQKAAIISTVSVFFEKKIREVIRNKPIVIIPNGYDPDSFEAIKEIKQQNEVLKIAYVGHIYDWHPIISFLRVISQFIKDMPNAKLQINFYGINIAEQLQKIITENFSEIGTYINIHPKIPNDLLIKKLAEENLLLLFNYYAFPGTKIYDYIALHRFILFCYSNDPEAKDLKEKYYPYIDADSNQEFAQEKLINETDSGFIVVDSFHLLQTLNNLYVEFLKEGQIKCNTVNATNYSRKYQVSKLAEIIKTLLSESK
jgi:glycosyltransferase involved in cell wall biosynthesis